MDKLDETERRKLATLYKEKAGDGRDSGRVDFLYKDRADPEDYLLGKRVDTRFEQENIPTKKESDVGALFDDDPIAHNAKMNMHIKEREDPLTAVRRQEEAARKALLNNPVKMKQLEKALKDRQKSGKRLRKDSSGDELLARYMAIKGAKLDDSKKKKKRKLPDDDKSLLMRYMELIGKARRKVFYPDSSEEEQSHSKPKSPVRDRKSPVRQRKSPVRQRKSPVRQRRSPVKDRTRSDLRDNQRSHQQNDHRDTGERRPRRLSRAEDQPRHSTDRGHRSRDSNRREERRVSDRANDRISPPPDKRRANPRDTSITGPHRDRGRDSYRHRSPTNRRKDRPSTGHCSRSRSPDSKSHSNNKHRSRKEPLRSKRDSSSSESDTGRMREKDRERRRQKVAKKRSRRQSSSSSSSSSGSDSSSTSHSSHSEPDRKSKPSHSQRSRTKSSSSPERGKEKTATRSYGLLHPKGESMLEAKARSDAERSSKKEMKTSTSSKARSPSPPKVPSSKKLTDEEKEARLREMMDNATWRDEQRARNVSKYEEEQRREDNDLARNAKREDDFIAPMMTKHASESSVEDQLRRNRHKIQRTAASTEKNFARK